MFEHQGQKKSRRLTMLLSLLVVVAMLFALPAMIFAQESDPGDDSNTPAPQTDSSFNRTYDQQVTITCDTPVYYTPESGPLNTGERLTPGQTFTALPYLFVLSDDTTSTVNTQGFVELSIASNSAPLYVPVECVSGFTNAGSITWTINRNESINNARNTGGQSGQSDVARLGRNGFVELQIASSAPPVYIPVECVSNFNSVGSLMWMTNRNETFTGARTGQTSQGLTVEQPASGVPLDRGYDQLVTITCSTPVYYAPGSAAIPGAAVYAGQTFFALPYVFMLDASMFDDDATATRTPDFAGALGGAEATEAPDDDAVEATETPDAEATETTSGGNG